MSGQAHLGTGSRVTIAAALDQATTERFYEFYRAAFEPLRTEAAGRHLLTLDEFTEEMADPRIDKYLAWDGDTVVGMTTVATDITTVPWISSDFYLSRYPEEATRGALYYLGFTLVDPAANTFRAYVNMIDAIAEQMLANRAVCGFDFCNYNATGAVGGMVTSLPRRYGATCTEVDVHLYYAVDFRSDDVRPQIVDEQHFYVADFRNATKPVRTPRQRTS